MYISYIEFITSVRKFDLKYFWFAFVIVKTNIHVNLMKYMLLMFLKIKFYQTWNCETDVR